jgi:hypothetical protein
LKFEFFSELEHMQNTITFAKHQTAANIMVVHCALAGPLLKQPDRELGDAGVLGCTMLGLSEGQGIPTGLLDRD